MGKETTTLNPSSESTKEHSHSPFLALSTIRTGQLITVLGTVHSLIHEYGNIQ